MDPGPLPAGLDRPARRLPRDAARIRTIAREPDVGDLIERLLAVACAGLPRMFDAERRVFFHSVHRAGGAPRPVGHSVRYGAMVALGARWLDESAQRPIFGGETAAEFTARVVAGAEAIQDFGDLAAVGWAASALGCEGVVPVLRRLVDELARAASPYTVELAWSLSALVAGRSWLRDSTAADALCARLRGVFAPRAGVFPHLVGPGGGQLRRHVACFADQVYPIQALARYHAAFGDPAALAAAVRCAEQICAVQGAEGQWWWHYDARNGSVIEGYPVYSVHQDAMGPMALFDLHEAGGPDFRDAIRRSLAWMARAPEVQRSLISEDPPVIWRKVGRAEPGKLVRTVRAGASRLHESLRLRPLDALFRATRIDYECRPYHLGWILDTWLAR